MDEIKIIEAFDEAKQEVWTDDDQYTVGYNNGLEAGKNIAIDLLRVQEVIEGTIEETRSEWPDEALPFSRNETREYPVDNSGRNKA